VRAAARKSLRASTAALVRLGALAFESQPVGHILPHSSAAHSEIVLLHSPAAAQEFL